MSASGAVQGKGECAAHESSRQDGPGVLNGIVDYIFQILLRITNGWNG